MNKIEIIAEIGQNHNGDMELAKKMIKAVKDCGADVAKFQLFEAKKIFPQTPDYPWFAYNCQTELKREQVRELKAECDRVGIEFLASVFDEERIEWLEELEVRRYKIASRSVNDASLVNKIYAIGKPVILSLGMWDETDFPKTPDNSRTSFLYCIAKYPAPLEDLKLAQIDFNKFAGFSDHTVGISAPIAAMARGAKIIEKHFTLDKKTYGPDHEGSATPEEFIMINNFRNDLNKII